MARTTITAATKLWAAIAAAAVLMLGATVALSYTGTPGGGGAEVRVQVELSEFAISPSAITVPADTPVVFEVTNAGSVPHDFVIEGVARSEVLQGGTSTTLRVEGIPAGEYGTLCEEPGHAAAGMVGTLTASADGAADAASHGGHGPDTDWEALDLATAASLAPFPAETEGRGNQLLEPEEILSDGTKVFRLVAEVIDWEVEPGRFVEGWSYNGQIPGPMIKVGVGDRIRVLVENKLPLGTEIHWHGVRVPNDQDGVAGLTQPLIAPGETYTYEFVTTEPAIAMYHPHHHGNMKLPNGMFGVFIVGEMGEDIPLPSGVIGGLEVPEEIDVATEIPMVLNDAGSIGLSLNGKSFPATEPIVVGLDEWFVIHYYNEGLQSHPMHLHGAPQLVFAKDGFPLDAPRWEDTVNVAPGERYSVLVHARDPGAWVFHCHILTHAERAEGLFGMVTALIVE